MYAYTPDIPGLLKGFEGQKQVKYTILQQVSRWYIKCRTLTYNQMQIMKYIVVHLVLVKK